MANNGSFNLTRTGSTSSYISFKCYWSQAKDDSNNSSSLNVWVNASKSSSSTSATFGTQTTTITVEDSSKSSSGSFTLNPGKMITLCDKDFTVSHNTDGTKSVKISASVGGDVMWGNGSATVTLDTIPRASILGTISNFTLGNSFTIPITKYVSSFTDTLTISLNGTTIKTVSGITNGASVNFTDAELTKIYSLLPSSTSGTFTFKLTTKNGSTTVGTSSKTAKGTINTDVVRPTYPTYTIEEVGEVPTEWGVFVRNKSKLKFKVSATAGEGASLTNLTTKFDGMTYNGEEFETELIKTAGDLTVDISATDSRMITSSSARALTIIDYDVPYITNASAIRSDAGGTFDDSGTFLRVDLVAGVYPIENNNTASYEIHYKKTTEEEWTIKSIGGDSLTYDGYVRIPGLDINSSYDVKIVIKDYFSEVTKILPRVSSTFTTVDYLDGGHGMAIGKVAEKEDTLDIDFYVEMQKELNVIGEIQQNGINILDIIYPVGNIYITNINNDPSSLFGGTWELVKKEFIELAETYTIGNANCPFVKTDNITSGTVYLVRSGQNIRIRIDLVTAVALSDSSVDLGDLSWDALGITNPYMAFYGILSFSDGGNGAVYTGLTLEGILRATDILPKTDGGTIASGTSLNIQYEFNIDSSRMLDDACDKFYWKRIS